jgi:DNA polymerase-3 subunit delta'
MNNLPNWLSEEAAALDALVSRQRMPHAALMHGPAGTGRRLFALWLVGRLLGLRDIDLSPAISAEPFFDPESLPQHPDFQLVQPEPDKQRISIDKIRDTIRFLNLKSHQAGAKVALIWPAHSMTRAAANSLLKTLEEPPGSSCLVLVAAAQSRLPATIVSRCRCVRIPIPSRPAAQAWLKSQADGQDWEIALDLAGGAPMAAMSLLQSGFPAVAAGFAQDITALVRRKVTPAVVAGRWAKNDPDLYLSWLYRRISEEIRTASGAADEHGRQITGFGDLQIVRESLNIEKSYADLREIDELRRLQGAGLNQGLQLTKILTRWYGGVQA